MNKGFTIIELLASIAIMALIIVISIPTYEGISNTIKQNSYKSKISMLTKSTSAYINKYHKDEIFDGNKNILLISIPYLIEKNVFSADDPETNTITNPLGGNLEGYLKITYNVDNYEIIVEYEEPLDSNIFQTKVENYNNSLNKYKINNGIVNDYNKTQYENIKNNLKNDETNIILIYKG